MQPHRQAVAGGIDCLYSFVEFLALELHDMEHRAEHLSLQRINVIDLDQLDLGLPEYVYDYPHGAGRYIQRASGYQTTLVNGQVFMQNGEPTGNLAGEMLRNQ